MQRLRLCLHLTSACPCFCSVALIHLIAPARPPAAVRAESDARYGGFDFRAAHEAAPADLRDLLDNTESLPFRRRGYERDGMLR